MALSPNFTPVNREDADKRITLRAGQARARVAVGGITVTGLAVFRLDGCVSDRSLVPAAIADNLISILRTGDEVILPGRYTAEQVQTLGSTRQGHD